MRLDGLPGFLGRHFAGKIETMRIKPDIKIHRGVEQLAARWAHNPKVAGSSPAPATKRVRIKFPALFFVSPQNAND